VFLSSPWRRETLVVPANWSMIPEKRAPDLIPGWIPVSGKIMGQQQASVMIG
jgi:hypothetical protein